VVDQSESRLAASVAGAPATEGLPAIQADPRVLDEIVRRLVAALAPERIYLFGSRARGDATEDSDYDIMVVVRERTGPGHHTELRAFQALPGLGVPKDVVVMTADRFNWLCEAAASLPATVEREGRLLYAS
jgi:uncharacterized protein